MLTIPAEYLGHELSLGTNLLLAAGAVVAASITYLLIERPIRFSTKLSARPRVSLALGLSLAASSFAVATYLIDTHPLVL
jgi:hypothetical protein